MKIGGIFVRIFIVAAVTALMLGGKAFAGDHTLEIDPRMATGGLTLLGVGIVMLLERHRRD